MKAIHTRNFRGTGLLKIVGVNTSLMDSAGNEYVIDFDQNAIHKYDDSNTPLFTITSDTLGRASFSPVALDLDDNDNLIIADNSANKIFKINSEGYYLFELPWESTASWVDTNIILQRPDAVAVDDRGDLLISDFDGSRTQKCADGRGVIDIVNLIADIRLPYENSLVYAYIPVTGTAAGSSFYGYTVDYGYGRDPIEWTTLVTAYNEVFDDYKPITGNRTLYGNLATFKVTEGAYDRTGGLPMGIYTIRLRVYNRMGDYEEARVSVQVARVVGNTGGSIPSDDGLVILDLPNGAITDDQELFSIHRADPLYVPPVQDPWIIPVGNVYEIKPAGYTFTKPCTLSMYYTDNQTGGIEEKTLKIYRWNPLIQRWIYVDADLDMENNALTTTLTEFNEYQVFYAVMSDPPPAPVIYQPASPTHLTNLSVFGKAAPSVKVEVFVNGLSQGMAGADANTGHFIMPGVLLDSGDNILTAIATDPMGNNSKPSAPVTVQVMLVQPHEIESVVLKTSDFSDDFTGDVAIGEELYIELTGEDPDPGNAHGAMVTVTSSVSDPQGIEVQLLETAADSGVFRGIAKVGKISDPASGTIGVSSSLTETITVASRIDPTKFDEVDTEDKVPPPAPTISSPTHPSLCQDTFEADLGQWSNMSNIFGASVLQSDDTAATGNFAVKLINMEEGGDFANYIRWEPFDAREYPMISFDYKIPADVKVNLIGYVNGMWKEIVFTDDPKTAETFDEDLYRSIGAIEGVTADNTWRHAEFNLYTLLKNDDPTQEMYLVEELFFADYDLPGWMELIMGEENYQGAVWYADNFIISAGGQSDNAPVFTWTPNDESVTAYSYLLDQYADTVPDQEAEGSESQCSFYDIEDGVWYFHVRSVDSGGKWGPANHYQIMVDTTGPIAERPFPEDGSSSGSLEVSVHLTDGAGSGVNPDSLVLAFNDITYDMSSGGLHYDEDNKILTFALWKVSPVQEPWPDGQVVEARVMAADDFAGNPIGEVFTWSWTVDYSVLTGGTFSLLTTRGGYTPSWSFDGSRIAFMSQRSGNADIWIIEATDYAEQEETAFQVTYDSSGDHHPAWSPVNASLAFVSDRDGTDHIYLINADGSGLKQLTFGPEADSHPTWSPDGSKIAFSRGGEIWAIKADGTEEEQITCDSIEYYLEPSWSWTSNQIAFTKSLYVDEVAVMNPDGTDQRVLTQSGYDFLPAWSKQTDQIIFVTMRDEKTSALRMIYSNGSVEYEYISNEGMWWDSEPDQSPVDDNLAFQSTRNGTWNIWVKTQLALGPLSIYPDPFSPNNDGTEDTTEITFQFMGGAAFVDLKVYDCSGEPVKVLYDRTFIEPGEHTIIWDGTGSNGNKAPDGVYTCRLEVEGGGQEAWFKKTGNVRIDTTPPTFVDWSILEDIVAFGPQTISVRLIDASGINTEASQLQYGISSVKDQAIPNVIEWTDFGNGTEGTLDLGWDKVKDNYLYIRAYAEDMLGNCAYSKVQKRLIRSDNESLISNYAPSTPVLYLPEQMITIATPEAPVLSVYNSTDPDGDILTYDFEIYQNNSFRLPSVGRIYDIPEDELITSWLFDLTLAEDKWYSWKVRAFDSIAYSDWMDHGAFYVNQERELTSVYPGLNLMSFPPGFEETCSTVSDLMGYLKDQNIQIIKIQTYQAEPPGWLTFTGDDGENIPFTPGMSWLLYSDLPERKVIDIDLPVSGFVPIGNQRLNLSGSLNMLNFHTLSRVIGNGETRQLKWPDKLFDRFNLMTGKESTCIMRFDNEEGKWKGRYQFFGRQAGSDSEMGKKGYIVYTQNGLR